MKKKIYVGMAFCIATTFWACGSGDIVKYEDADGLVAVWPDREDPEHQSTTVTVGVNAEVVTEQTCPACFIGGTPSSSSIRQQQPTYSSSSIYTPKISSPVVSSSSEGGINLNSSSSYIWYPPSSSSGYRPPVQSSSSIPQNPDGGGGTCAPVKPIVEQGEPVYWKYTIGGNVKTTDVLSAQFKWSTPGGTPETFDGKGSKFMTDTVNYATSGQHTATLNLGTTKGTFDLVCSPVQVNGAKITGCKCATEAKSVDFTATPGVNWSVTGCSTGAGLTLSYEWDGVEGTSTTYTKNFTEAFEAYSPKLLVKNNDNTMVEVTCPPVKITDGPEFEITTTQKAGAIDLPKGSSVVVVNITSSNEGIVFCQVDRVKANSSTGALNGSVNKVALKGSDYIEARLGGPISAGTSLAFELDIPATCGVR